MNIWARNEATDSRSLESLVLKNTTGNPSQEAVWTGRVRMMEDRKCIGTLKTQNRTFFLRHGFYFEKSPGIRLSHFFR